MRKRPATSYSAALSILVVALLLRMMLNQALPLGFPYLTFFPSIVIIAFICGTGPAILASVLAGLASWYFFIPPFHSFAIEAPSILALVFFALIVGINIAVIHRLFESLALVDAERKRALSLAAQRDVLFRELQHRIGNNLNMISALLNIQSRGITDARSKQALAEAARRISVIADINRMFHDPAHADGVIDDGFVRELGLKCLDAAGAGDRVRFEARITPIALAQEQFLPVSLIMTECINNALEHGLGRTGGGRIEVALRQDLVGRRLELTVHDNGSGLPEDFDLAKSKSIGLMVVRSFTTQLRGTFTMENVQGTLCTLTFPDPAEAAAQSVAPGLEPATPLQQSPAPQGAAI
jgi:two-component sensor histidine kinase